MLGTIFPLRDYERQLLENQVQILAALDRLSVDSITPYLYPFTFEDCIKKSRVILRKDTKTKEEQEQREKQWQESVIEEKRKEIDRLKAEIASLNQDHARMVDAAEFTAPCGGA